MPFHETNQALQPHQHSTKTYYPSYTKNDIRVPVVFLHQVDQSELSNGGEGEADDEEPEAVVVVMVVVVIVVGGGGGRGGGHISTIVVVVVVVVRRAGVGSNHSKGTISGEEYSNSPIINHFLHHNLPKWVIGKWRRRREEEGSTVLTHSRR